MMNGGVSGGKKSWENRHIQSFRHNNITLRTDTDRQKEIRRASVSDARKNNPPGCYM